MLREVLISIILLTFGMEKYYVYGGEPMNVNRYNAPVRATVDSGGGGGGGGGVADAADVSKSISSGLDASATNGNYIIQKAHHTHNPQYSSHNVVHHPSSSSSSVTPGSGSMLSGIASHMESRSSYNLLSEAMSQAVTNEFSSMSMSSSDGACHVDDLECYSMQDRLGMEAIRTLHRQLDDDENGNIDLSESDDFLREELKYDSGYEKRQKAFHYNDDMHISVKELWEAWLRSEVHNWTIEQTTDWLAQSVQLPQYVDLFKIHKVTGATLPRLAVNNMHYVANVLGIKDPIHKQKIALKAMDVVLFGPPRETGTRWKDYILVTLLLSAIIGCWYAYQQNKNAKRHLRRMAQDMEGLQKAEQSLQEMQKELERARMEQESVATQKMDLERRLKEVPSLTASTSDLEVKQLKKEIEMLRSELSRAEVELEDNCWAPPPQLQSWLQYTYELESKYHLKKRAAAERQLQCAREACEKLRKKRSSLVGAFVSTHGKSIDDVDRSIVEARNALGEVTNELQERLHRWKQIEQCLGMNIVNNNGLSYLESILYGRNNGGSSTGSLKGSRGRMASSTDDLDDDSVQGYNDGYQQQQQQQQRNSSHSSGTASHNSNLNTLRSDDNDMDSEDGSTETTSVHFYLGNVPPSTIATTITTTASAQVAGAITTTTASMALRSPPSPLTATATATSSSSSVAAAIENHMNQTISGSFASFNSLSLSHGLNDDDDGNRHSPSVSSERSVIVPPRTKKHTPTSSVTSINALGIQPPPPPPPPPPPTNPIGRIPQPPPRKANQSLHGKSQNCDIINKQTTHPTIITKSNNVHGNMNGTMNTKSKGKMMIKQHSTASQQSTSSTASSVQSAPDLGKASSSSSSSSPSRTHLVNDKILPTYQQHQQHQQQHMQHNMHPKIMPLHQTTTVAYHQPSHVIKPFITSKTSLNSELTKVEEYLKKQHDTHASLFANNVHHYSETHLDNIKSNNEINMTIAENNHDDNNTNAITILKKRRKGLRFGFGRKKKSHQIEYNIKEVITDK